MNLKPWNKIKRLSITEVRAALTEMVEMIQTEKVIIVEHRGMPKYCIVECETLVDMIRELQNLSNTIARKGE